MKKQDILNKAFTLVEVLVSMTIFSIMIVSIIWIYIVSSDITMKSDINRIMQENLKNVSNKIAEDIRKNGISGVSLTAVDLCDFDMGTNNYKQGSKLCTNSGNDYYLAKESGGTYLRVDSSQCSSITDHCVIYNLNNGPLTNSFVSVKKLDFYLSNDYVPKVTINITIQPAMNKGVKSNLIKESKIIFQTTVSERPF